MNAARADGPARLRRRRAWLVGAALVLCAAAAAALVAWNELRVRQAAGQRYVQALAESHARQVGYGIEAIERAFRGLADGLSVIEVAAPDAAPALARSAIAGIAQRHEGIGHIRVGQAAPEFVPAAPGAGRLYLGRPFRSGRGEWRIPLAMMLLEPGPDGARWLQAELDVDAFSEVLRSHEVGRDGVASVLTRDAMLIARSDSGTRHAGLVASTSPVFRALAHAPAGVVESRSQLDGVLRVVGYREVEGRDLVATVGMTPRALHGGWWAFVAALALGTLLLLGVWALGMHFLDRANRRELRMLERIAASKDTVDHLRERVRDAEAQYRFLYEQHPLPAFVYDREQLAILEVNDAALAQYGYDRDSVLGLPVRRLLAEVDTEDDVREEIRSHPQAYGRRVWSHRRRDGSAFSALVFARDIASFGGRPARLLLALDVTEHLRAEADLRLLRRAVEATEEGVFIIEAERRVLVYGNAAFSQLTGVDASREPSAERAAVNAIADVRARMVLLGALERGEDACVEVMDDRAPAPRWLEVRVAPVLDREGRATHFVGIVTDVSSSHRAAEEMAYRASHDGLTGLANRERLLEAIDQATADGSAGTIAVCHVDLDRFQLINDSLGHAVGDELLVALARRLEEAVGTQGLVARLGGDEFGVLLTGDGGDGIRARVEALRAAVAQPALIRGVALLMTASLGYSRHPDDGAGGAALLRAATQAGRQAKRGGRNRSVPYEPAFDPRSGERLLLVQELHRALQEGEFELAFQLQFDGDGTPTGMEALARWRHPEHGLLGPARFMEACEDSGLVVPLGSWVLGEAARCWRTLDERGWGGLRMGVNVSALQMQEQLVEDVAAVTEAFGLPRGALELELTESVLLSNPAAARRVMEALSDLGASIAIDDFGTGYSSLAYLKHLPLQRLKLDQSFVRDLGRDPDNEAICSAILRMAQALELRVTAEGVETREQHDWLHQRGCEEFQGYLLAMPAAFDEVLARLGRGPAR